MGTVAKWATIVLLVATACGDTNGASTEPDDVLTPDSGDEVVDVGSDPSDTTLDNRFDEYDLPDRGEPPLLIEAALIAGHEGSQEENGALGGELSLAIDQRGALLVGDGEFDELHLFSVNEDELEASVIVDIPWGSLAEADSELVDVASSRSGTVFVLSHNPSQVVALAPSDGLDSPYYAADDLLGTAALPNDPRHILVDSADTLAVLGVSDDGLTLRLLDDDQSLIHDLDAPRPSETYPSCVAADEAGSRLLLCDGGDGLRTLGYSAGSEAVIADSGASAGAASDQFGALYVSDPSTGSVRVLHPETNAPLYQFSGALDNPFQTPGAVLVSRELNLVLVADEGTHTITGFSLDVLQGHAGLRYLSVSGPCRGVTGSTVTFRIDLLDRDLGRDWMSFEREATLVVQGQDETRTFQTVLNHGVGSIQVPVGAEGTYTIDVSAAGLESHHSLEAVSVEEATVLSGSLSGADLTWEEGAIVRLSGDTTVPAGETLAIEEDVVLLLDEGVNLTLRGRMSAQGSRARPISIVATDPDSMWGVIDHLSSGTSSYDYVHVSGGGDIRRSGHCCGSMVRASDGSLEVRNSMFTDSPSKGMFTNQSDVLMRNTVFERLAMGAELFGDVDLSGMTFASFDGSDDNDAIYVRDGTSQVISSSVFVGGSDDGVDLLESSLELSNLIVRDFADKAISVNSGSPTIDDCLILNSEIGIGVKDSALEGPNTTTIRQVTVVNQSVAGLWVANKNGQSPNADIEVDLSGSIIWHSADTLRTDYEADKISVTNSNLNSDLSVERSGVIESDPLFLDENGSDFRLHPLSPAGEGETTGDVMGWSNQLD